jgi:dTDP-glucose 4,6-dehydratase
LPDSPVIKLKLINCRAIAGQLNNYFMKLLVTGGAGFIGSNFIHYWLKNYPNDQIINLDALTYAGNLDNLLDVADNLHYKFVKGDITDVKLVNETVKGVDLIVHFAAETHVDRSVKDSAAFIKTNVEGTRVLLEAAKNNGNIRFHYISTDEVFGSLGPNDPKFNETTPYDPRSPYSASKAASDHLVRAYYHTHKLPITISNCSNNYGSYQYPEKLIPLFITNLLEGKKVPVYGQGLNIRDWIHVDDHNRGVDLIIKKGKIGETYCLGGNQEMSNLEITKLILELMGQDETMIEYVSDRPGHDLRYAIDFKKAQTELGWQPTIDFKNGLQATIDWYKNNPAWWQKLKVKIKKINVSN